MSLHFQSNLNPLRSTSIYLSIFLLISPPIALAQEHRQNQLYGAKSVALNRDNPYKGTSSKHTQRKFDHIDRKAFSIKYTGKSVSELASILSQYATSEAEKARIIYTWVADNIAYDVKGFLSGYYGDLSPQGVLRKRTGVCTGHANLYQALAQQMGLKAVVLEGYAKGVGYGIGPENRPNHAWNAVRVNGRWHLLDPTWAAGFVDGTKFVKRFNPHYFATQPDQFIYDHYPSNPAWQLLPRPQSRATFDRRPIVSAQFFRDNLSFLNPQQHTIRSHGKAIIVLEAPTDVVAVFNISKAGQYIHKSHRQLRRQGQHLVADLAFPKPGNYKIYVFSKRRHEPGVYNYSVVYNVISR